MRSLVFIHGGGEDNRTWERQTAFFGGSHAVLAFDLPGRDTRHDEPAFDSHEDNAADVVYHMESAHMNAAVIVGHSMGGAIALTLALEHPARVQGLVLVATGAQLKMGAELLDLARRRASGEDRGTASIVPIEHLVAASATPAARAWVADRAMKAPATTIYADFRANDAFDVSDRISTITVPTLVIGGDEDQMAPRMLSEFLAKTIRGAHLTMLERCGHYPHIEHETRFIIALQSFLSPLPSR